MPASISWASTNNVHMGPHKKGPGKSGPDGGYLNGLQNLLKSGCDNHFVATTLAKFPLLKDARLAPVFRNDE